MMLRKLQYAKNKFLSRATAIVAIGPRQTEKPTSLHHETFMRGPVETSEVGYVRQTFALGGINAEEENYLAQGRRLREMGWETVPPNLRWGPSPPPHGDASVLSIFRELLLLDVRQSMK